MKKISRKTRVRDVKIGFLHRAGKGNKKKRRITLQTNFAYKALNKWIDKQRTKGLNITISNDKRIILYLPKSMNFYESYDLTVLYITAIRKLSEKKKLTINSYRLGSVNFDNLKIISTSAALVLTAELSKWDDVVRQRLRPMIDNWNEDILKKFLDLGFFDLFNNSVVESEKKKNSNISSVKLVKYIKGRCGDSNKTRILKSEITNIVGDTIKKWTFLHSGLTEAITNVSHHAYPEQLGFSEEEKNWYLTGSYNKDTKELKIAFYDQGIGIPKSLPASELWERTLQFLNRFSVADRKKDEVLLKAAVQLDRTSTEESDRGKGLQDLLEFIRQRGNGYLSILSLKGLYKYSLHNGIESIKTESFKNPICGTLIIWSATLQK